MNVNAKQREREREKERERERERERKRERERARVTDEIRQKISSEVSHCHHFLWRQHFSFTDKRPNDNFHFKSIRCFKNFFNTLPCLQIEFLVLLEASHLLYTSFYFYLCAGSSNYIGRLSYSHSYRGSDCLTH